MGERTNEIAILKVEAVELVASLLRVHHIFIDYERSALGVAGNALTDLAGRYQHSK